MTNILAGGAEAKGNASIRQIREKKRKKGESALEGAITSKQA